MNNKTWFFILFTIMVILFFSIFSLRKNIEKKEEATNGAMPAQAALENLRSLPYLSMAEIEEEDIGKFGVTNYSADLSYEGVNVYCSETENSAYFLDMHGNILHKISVEDSHPATRENSCKVLKKYGDNDFLMLIEMKKIIRVDWNSRIQWVKKGSFHHDLAVGNNGEIYALMEKKGRFPGINPQGPVIDNHIVILTPNGNIKKRISVAKMISKDSEILNLFKDPKKIYDCDDNLPDVFHINSIQVFSRDIMKGKTKLFEKGNLLISIRELNLIAVVDLREEKFVWHWGVDELDCQHHPSLLKNGNILIFDNGTHRKFSRIVELNPLTKEIEWEYKSNPESLFFTESRGSVQKLENQNILITESEKGRVFEVLKNGKIVWEFWNPVVHKNERVSIYRMSRFDPGQLEFLGSLE